MKNRLTYLYTLCLLALTLSSCEKDEDRLVAKQEALPVLSASSSTLVLNRSYAKDTIITFSATPADFGYDAAVKYSLQLDKKGNNFATPVTTDLGSTRSRKFTVTEFNSLLGLLKLTPGVAGEVELRVKSELSAFVAPVYSSVVTIMATPFADIIEYPSLYVPGSYQSWTPASAAKISSVLDDKIYEGYVNFPDASTDFKFTIAPNWNDTDYGDAGNQKLIAKGSNNLKVTEPGYYLLKANLNDLTWSATKTAWGVIGDATGSWANDKDMTYDPATKVWTITLALQPGEMKFRANDLWAINYGDNTPDDQNFTPDFNGKNIKIKEAGTYEVVLSLGIPGNYSYSLTKK